MLNRYPMSKAIMAMCLLVSLIPILILGGTVGYNNLKQAREHFYSQANSSLSAVYERFCYKLDQIHYASIELSLDEAVVDLTDPQGFEPSYLDGMCREIQKKLYNFGLISNVESAYLEYDALGRMGFRSDSEFFSQIGAGAYRERMRANRAANYLYHDPVKDNGYWVLPLIRRLFSAEGTAAGYLFVNIRLDNFNEEYAEFCGDALHFLILSANGVVLSSDEAQRRIGQVLPEFRQGEALELSGEKYRWVERVEPRSGMRILCYARSSAIYESVHGLILVTLAMCLLCVCLCAAVACIIAVWVSKPIRALIQSVHLQDGKNAPSLRFKAEKMSYPQLIQLLQQTIDARNEQQENRQKAEMKALMFQINPHFLYNTLASVIWLCDAGENEKAAAITKLLSDYFRVSVSKGKDIICLEDEISHVHSYLRIQEFRFEGRFEEKIDCPPALMRLPVPKLILQPLVENCICHGVDRTDAHCAISVDCRMTGRRLELRVLDDAGGMTPQRADEINRYLRDQSCAGNLDLGIGVSNVHTRLRLFAGGETGVYFRVDGNNVSATIVIDYGDKE